MQDREPQPIFARSLRERPFPDRGGLCNLDYFTDIWQYMPHGMCLLWQPWLVVLWAGSDLLIFLSYSAIPLALLQVLRKRKDVPHRGLVALFASFILLCGLTHLLSIVTLWYPIYPYVGLVKLATGIVSTITAVTLFRLIPTLVALPSPQEVAKVDQHLREEVAAHDATLAKLREARDAAEEKVELRTAELRDANAKLAVLTREAIHRSGNLLTVVTSLARQSAKDTDDVDDFVQTFIGRIRALNEATHSIIRGEDKASQEIETIIRKQLEPLTSTLNDRIRIEGPSLRIGSEAAQQISLAIHELATNAQKYGMLEDTASTIDVSWHIASGTDGEDHFDLVWNEQLLGQAPADFAVSQKEGFGTKLLTRIVPTVLRGRAERRFEADRFFYHLHAPLAAIASAADERDEGALAARIVDDSFGID